MAVAEINSASDKNIRYLRITPQEFAAALTEEGLPSDLVAALAEVVGTVLDGRSSFVTGGASRVLGRQPHDFADFVREAAARGVWDEEPGSLLKDLALVPTHSTPRIQQTELSKAT